MTQPKYAIKSDVEDYLGLTIDAALTSAVDSWLTASSDFVDKTTGRTFTVPTEDTTKKYDGNGKDKLPIDDLIAITSLTIDGVAMSTNDYLLYPANTLPWTSVAMKQYTQRNSRLTFANNSYIFTLGQQNVEIVGRFGYGDAIPDLVKLAVVKIVGGVIKECVGDKDVKELTQETLGDYSASFAKLADIANGLGVEKMLFPLCKEGSLGRPMRSSVSTGIVLI